MCGFSMGATDDIDTMKTFCLALVAAALIAAPSTSSAQILPTANERITGTILTYTNDNDEQRITLADDRGYTDHVTLANDIILRPADIQLTRGVRVVLSGYNAGKWFDALELTVIPARYQAR
jgi:hypothetical protein